MKSITFAQGVSMYMGAVLGSGILVLPGYTAELAGPSSIFSWVLLSLLSMPLAYTFARLALQYHHYGGIATIVENAFGRTWGAIVGWFFFVWVAVGQAVVGLIGAQYLVKLFGISAEWGYVIAFPFLLIACLTNLSGMKVTGRAALFLSGLVLMLLVLTIVFSLVHLEKINFTPVFTNGLDGVGRACVLIFWAFFGWEAITHLVPEFKHPQRDVMRSTWISVVLIGLVYTALSFVTVGTHTYGGEYSAAPLSVLMNRTLGISAEAATVLVVCIVCVGTLNVFLASSSRLGYALAQEEKLPRWFGKLNEKGVPVRSTLFLFTSNTFVLCIGYLFHLGADVLIMPPTTLGIIVYVIATLASLKILWHDRTGRITALISAAACAAIAPFAKDFLLVPLAVAALCLLYQLRVRKRRATTLRARGTVSEQKPRHAGD